jgi:hypothetical protein
MSLLVEEKSDTSMLRESEQRNEGTHSVPSASEVFRVPANGSPKGFRTSEANGANKFHKSRSDLPPHSSFSSVSMLRELENNISENSSVYSRVGSDSYIIPPPCRTKYISCCGIKIERGQLITYILIITVIILILLTIIGYFVIFRKS